MPTEWNTVVSLSIFLGTILGAVWGHSLWLSKQFSSLRELIYHKVDQLENNFIQKLEYHERHDDSRFNDIHTRIWELKLNQVSNKLLLDEK